jgi:hypothetical protein
MQNESGDFASGETANVESTVQVIMALCELKIDPQGSQFTKNGHTALESLLHYYVTGGGFKHASPDSAADLMSTEQGFYALAAYRRYLDGKSSFYNMTDINFSPDSAAQIAGVGLPGKNPDVKAVAIIRADYTFDDIQNFDTRTAIEALAARGIASGVGGNSFEPNRSITRAEFAAIVVRALGLTPTAVEVFADVPESSWYAAYVGTAYKYGIVSGVSVSDFAPSASITREQAAVMVERAGKLCGLKTDVTDADIQAGLSRFKDYQDCADWSREALTLCFRQNILMVDSDSIEPQKEITRAEMADMLYRMLEKAELI